MSDTCPIPTPAERQYLEVQDRAERAMLATICQALEDAARQAAEGLQDTDFREDPPGQDYFTAVAHQKLFVRLCGGDPVTFEGGDPDIAAHVIDNCRKISGHYWMKNGENGSPADPSD